VAPGARRQVTTLSLGPGDLLCLYTDGLVERPGQIIDNGLRRLAEVVRPQPPEAACAEVMAALVGREPARDDIALLMLRRRP
jgi:sigma-B regulation protein RsbU (phosphoserine phosphatase)